MKPQSRREFFATAIKGSIAAGISAKSYRQILGSNDRVNVAVAGINSRGQAHLSMAQALNKQVKVIGLVDPDTRTFARAFKAYADILDSSTLQMADVRKMLENKDLDALTIAAPDHWHAPMAIMAMQAGKHVYLEKPCCHNPAEGDLLAAAEKKYGKIIQIGNQQRSAPTSISLKKQLDEGVIGDVYYGKTYYEANRGTIGKGTPRATPAELNWDLWQGPAPRKALMSNYIHYNWHWFWHWGTGEIVNNGLHELDVARWLMNLNLPTKVTSAGGRFAFKDDWEFYDTQNASFEFDGGRMITWEGRSCNGMGVHKTAGGRGTWLHGTKGTAFVDREGYKIFNVGGKEIKAEVESNGKSSVDTLGISGLDNYHFLNFLEAIQKGITLNSPVAEAVKSTLMCHLGNMSQKVGKTLVVDQATGKPKDSSAMKMWGRTYEKGWKPVV